MFGIGKRKYARETDLLVLGSGAAGLTAAITARDAGAEVLVLEKSGRVGGTSAVSGGVVWVPCNPHMAEVGVSDSRAEALTYLRKIADDRTEDTLLERFLDAAPEMIRALEASTPLKFVALGEYPDYHPELPGGKPGGRSMEAGLFDTNELGPWKDKLRRSPIFGGTPMTVTEAMTWGVFSKPLALPYAELGKRYKAGMVCYGGSLIGRLLKGCLDRKVEPQLDTTALSLIEEDGRICGVVARQGGQEIAIKARKGVLLATGGFEWDAGLVRRFLGVPLTHPNSPPTNTGDGLRMAMAAGADLGNVGEAWWCPSVVVPGEEYDGKPLNRGDFSIRSLPHSIIVNRRGQRFVNEAANYNDLMKPFFNFEPNAYERPNLPAWLIVDRQFLEKYILVTAVPGMQTPEFITQGATLAELAAKMGIDPAGLEATVARFNAFAVEGKDRDFGRGDSLYDRFYGDPARTLNPNLGALEKAPFYALPVHSGSIGTKGGPRVDVDARVLHVEGGPIPGLYAAGNVMAGITGPGYPGAGSTIGVAMTFGWLAARHAAGARPGGGR
jgi:succinate dehydrogenase/fumarate reductase flavoprotein subunit